MSARSRMTQRAQLQRYSVGAEGDSGNETTPGAWANVGDRIPIWLYGSTEREAVTEETTAVVTDLKAMVPRSTSVTESDRLGGPGVAAIVDRLGNVLEAGVLGIETVLIKRTHIQLTLSRVAG
jgi:hypothetical protein